MGFQFFKAHINHVGHDLYWHYTYLIHLPNMLKGSNRIKNLYSWLYKEELGDRWSEVSRDNAQSCTLFLYTSPAPSQFLQLS